MSLPTRSEIKAISVIEIVHAFEKLPEAWPILKAGLLGIIDQFLAIAPAPIKEALQRLRDILDAATELPPGLIDDIFGAIKSAILATQFGPATHDDSDLA